MSQDHLKNISAGVDTRAKAAGKNPSNSNITIDFDIVFQKWVGIMRVDLRDQRFKKEARLENFTELFNLCQEYYIPVDEIVNNKKKICSVLITEEKPKKKSAYDWANWKKNLNEDFDIAVAGLIIPDTPRQIEESGRDPFEVIMPDDDRINKWLGDKYGQVTDNMKKEAHTIGTSTNLIWANDRFNYLYEN